MAPELIELTLLWYNKGLGIKMVCEIILLKTALKNCEGIEKKPKKPTKDSRMT